MKLNPYLHFPGTCREAFTFYAEIMQGEIAAMMTYAQAPPGMPVADDMRDKVMHAQLSIGDAVLMGSDQAVHAGQPVGFDVTLHVDSEAEAGRIFDALAAQGEIRMKLTATFFARSFGVVTDRFGVPWMIILI